MSLLVWQEEKKKQNNKTNKSQTGEDITFQGSKQTEGQIVPQAVTVSLGNKHILLAFIFSTAELQHVKGVLSFKTWIQKYCLLLGYHKTNLSGLGYTV